MISPGYFETLRIPLLRGRRLTEVDQAAGAPLAAVVDARLAERFFPDQNPIGQSIAMYKGWAEIVGVVATVRGTTLEEGSRPTVYYPLAQVPFFPQAVAIVRSRVQAGPIIRDAVRRANRAAPVFDVRTMNERITESIGMRRVVAGLLAVFGAISLLLAAIGVYGVIAQVVGERTQEIGIRMALGARPAQILAQFMRLGLRAGMVGLICGFLAAGYAQRWVAAMLYQPHGFDVVSFSAGSTGILVILAVSVWWPARRAARTDPQEALRHE
jgi:hypothetical protein